MKTISILFFYLFIVSKLFASDFDSTFVAKPFQLSITPPFFGIGIPVGESKDIANSSISIMQVEMNYQTKMKAGVGCKVTIFKGSVSRAEIDNLYGPKLLDSQEELSFTENTNAPPFLNENLSVAIFLFYPIFEKENTSIITKIGCSLKEVDNLARQTDKNLLEYVNYNDNLNRNYKIHYSYEKLPVIAYFAEISLHRYLNKKFGIFCSLVYEWSKSKMKIQFKEDLYESGEYSDIIIDTIYDTINFSTFAFNIGFSLAFGSD